MAAHEELEALGRDIAARCPLRGFFKMDFKQDPRDGRWHLLEINARGSLWMYLGAVNGVNLGRAAYEYLVHGRRPEPAVARNADRWLAIGLDARAYRELSARGELGFGRWIGSILASRNIYNVFSWSDPAPWITTWKGKLARRISRAPRRVFSLLSPWRSTAS